MKKWWQSKKLFLSVYGTLGIICIGLIQGLTDMSTAVASISITTIGVLCTVTVAGQAAVDNTTKKYE